MNHNQQVSYVEYSWEQGVEEETWKQELAKLHIMSKDTNFHLTYQYVVAADLLLFNQAQLTQLLKMMKGDAGAAKMQGTLNLSDANWAAGF